MRKSILISALAFVIASCTVQNEPVIGQDAKPIALKTAQKVKIDQDNSFAIDLLKKTIDVSGETNIFVSPLSVSIALGMAWNGASGETKTEMETAMKMSGMTVADINDYYKIMQSTLPSIDPSTKLSIANSIWYRKDFSVKQNFLNINADYFNAYIKELDFSKSWATDTINNWCSKKTNKLIPTIIDQIPENAMLYLINAVYFKGIWRQKFDKKQTTESNFTNELNKQVKVNMMYQKDTFGYAVDDNAQYVDMVYGNKAYSMTVILPLEGKTTADVLNNITAESWKSVLGNLNQREIMLYLPRFKTECKFKLNQMLQDMGMKKAFSDFAEFPNISDTSLMISEVIHKTYVTVDEEGTEAAAVTSIGFVTTSMPDYPVIRVDKPFVFVIHEKSTGVILFIGKMGNVEKY